MNKLLAIFRFFRFHYGGNVGRHTLRTILSPRDWEEKEKKIFQYNLVIGVITLFVLSFVNNSTFGQKLLNDLYDSIVVADFQDASEHPDRIAPAVALVEFDPRTYDAAENHGFWTPRHTLGAVIEAAASARAKVVLVDFTVTRKAPVYLHQGQPLDENALLLDALTRAVDQARQTGTVVVLPQAGDPPAGDEYAARLAALRAAAPDVIKTGLTSVMTDRYDETVRNMLFYKITGPGPGGVVFSMPVLAYLYGSLPRDRADAAVQSLAGRIASDPDFKGAPLPGGNPKVALYPYDPDKECLPAKLRYRIADRDTYARLGVDDDPFFGRRFRPDAFVDEAAKGGGDIPDNAVVVVGSTNPEMGDVHKTPLGALQGVYVLINEANMLLTASQIDQNPYLKYATDLVSILILSVLFTHIPLTLSLMVLGFFVSSIRTSVASYLFIRFGIFLDAWVPMVGICFYANIHNFISSYLQFRAKEETCA